MSEINLNEEVEEVVNDAEVMTVNIDETLSVSGEAADAAAVGAALALKADASSVNNIKVNDQSADNQGQILVTGEDIPLNSSNNAPTIADAVAAVQDVTGDQIPMSASDETKVADRITALESSSAGCVKKVNNNLPDANGNVSLNKVPMADNLESSTKQQSSGEYIVRTTGGTASISDGPANLMRVLGNSVHTGFTPESLDLTVNSDSCEASVTNIDTFRTAMENSGTLTLTYTTEWSDDPTDYGITVTGTPENGDTIVAVWVKEERGLITNANPTGFSVTGWNLYNQTAGYARVVKYSDDYGYAISGTYTSLGFSATESGEQTTITPGTGGLFQVPSDGYVWVTGGGSDTAIWTTWSDWIAGYQGNYQAYNKTTISLSAIMIACFSSGLCSVGNVRDYIDIAGGYAYSWISVMEYSAENLATAESSGRPYIYDEDYIYLVKANATVTALSGGLTISGSYQANGHGLEMFDGTDVGTGSLTSYGVDLRNKLERDVLTVSQQTLNNNEKKQALNNIGAVGVIAQSLTDSQKKQAAKNINAVQYGTASKEIVENGITYRFFRAGNVVQVTAHAGKTTNQIAADENLLTVPNGYHAATNIYWYNGEAQFFTNTGGTQFYCRSQIAANKTLRFGVVYITNDAMPA